MYVALDVGGTSTRIAVSSNLIDIDKHVKFDTIHDIPRFSEALNYTIKQLIGIEKVDAICAGFAGYFNKDRTRIIRAANFHPLEKVNLPELFGQEYKNVPMFFENDACLAGLGEAVLGAGKEALTVGYISLGTGVGGTLIENKQLSHTNRIFGPGHQVIDLNSTYTDGLGIRGTLETFASGSGFYKQFKKNPLACREQQTWEKFGYNLGVGLINVSMLWNPDVIVLGGGVTDRFKLFYPGIVRAFSQVGDYPMPTVVKSAFGEGSGVIGAFVLTKSRLSI